MEICPCCGYDELIENLDSEAWCLECGWSEPGIGMGRRSLLQELLGYQEELA